MNGEGIEIGRTQVRRRRRWIRYLKRLLIGISISLNIVLITSIAAGYFVYRHLFNRVDLTNVETLSDLKLPAFIEDSDLLAKILQLQEKQFNSVNNLIQE